METSAMAAKSKSPERLPRLLVGSPPPTKTKTKSVVKDIHLPLIPAATKAEKYSRLRHFDKHELKREKAHFRNALKTTEPIEKITKQLDDRLASLGEDDDESVSFERLAAFSDAFEALIGLGGEHAPELRKIKDAYHKHIMDLLSEEAQPSDNIFIPTLKEPHPPNMPTSNRELLKLRKQLHSLEVEYRVAAQKNQTLREELAKEEKISEEVMAELDKPLETTPTEQDHELDYVAQVEHLQQQIAEETAALNKVKEERKGRVPLSVCHQLEQCIREVDIEIQKEQRRNEKITKELEEVTQQLEDLFRSHGYDLTGSEILKELESAVSQQESAHDTDKAKTL